MGRHRKFELGEIVRDCDPDQGNLQRYVVVDYESTDDVRRYRVIPLDYKSRRRGDAIWMPSWLLESTGERSGTASVRTYRANEALSGDRVCSCQCCIHESYDAREWTSHGRWRDPEPEEHDPDVTLCAAMACDLIHHE